MVYSSELHTPGAAYSLPPYRFPCWLSGSASKLKIVRRLTASMLWLIFRKRTPSLSLPVVNLGEKLKFFLTGEILSIFNKFYYHRKFWGPCLQWPQPGGSHDCRHSWPWPGLWSVQPTHGLVTACESPSWPAVSQAHPRLTGRPVLCSYISRKLYLDNIPQ